MKRWEAYFWPLLVAANGLLVWHLALIWTKTRIFPSPMDVERGIAELVNKGLLWRYMGDSLLRVGVGYSLALVFGVPLGVVLGYYPTAARMVNPVIQMLRPISPLAW